MLKIRPHHLLCMKACIGKGYNKEFNINKEKIEYICLDCGWYNITNCKLLLLK